MLKRLVYLCLALSFFVVVAAGCYQIPGLGSKVSASQSQSQNQGVNYTTDPGSSSVPSDSSQTSQSNGVPGQSESRSSNTASVPVSSRWDPNYEPLKEQLDAYITNLNQQYSEMWGIYFVDLTSGKTFGINQDLQVPAASTVKVPVVLYASYLVSQGKLSWDERLTYVKARDWRDGSGSLQFTAKDGDTFSIGELCDKAIIESDNVAWKMLERRLGLDNIAQFMRDIGGQTVYPNGQNISTPRDLAAYMMAALRFSQESPEGQKLIYDLTYTIWNTGLNRYISDVTVAHKEGDVTGVANDVGIVYARHPYIVAIMSYGHSDVEKGFATIGDISKMIYDYQTGLQQ